VRWVGPGQIKLAQSCIPVPVSPLQRYPITVYQDYEFLAVEDKPGPYLLREATNELGDPPSDEPKAVVGEGSLHLRHGSSD
jgi:hypothetical protein